MLREELSMKRYMARVGVLLLAGMLISCGGGGGDDSPSGGGSPATGGGSPATADGGSPATPTDSSPATPTDSSPATTTGGTPGTTTGGTTDTTTGGTTTGTGGTTGGTTTGGTPGPTLPSAGALVEESDAAVTLSAGWTPTDPLYGWSGGAARQSSTAGATVSFTFTGTSVRWIGALSRDGGIALVRVDGGTTKGKDFFEVDLFTRPREMRTPVITIYDLSPGQHTLTIEVTGRQNPDADSNVVVVDAFEVEPQIVSHWQETHPDAIFSAGWVQADTRFHWSGCCVRTEPDPPRGGAWVTETAGGKVTLKFRGTSIAWIGYRGPNAGIARVQVDGGEVSEVDLYSPANKIQEVVFTATGLADTTHTLTIEATGLKNEASAGAQVVVDAFDVTTPGRRYQEGDPAITYVGGWTDRNDARVWSEGGAAATDQAGATATFSFTGTSVSWITCQKSNQGRARVYIDGAFVTEINNRKSLPIEAFQYAAFRADGLTNGPHTLTIEVVADGPFIVVDAFDVHP